MNDFCESQQSCLSHCGRALISYLSHYKPILYLSILSAKHGRLYSNPSWAHFLTVTLHFAKKAAAAPLVRPVVSPPPLWGTHNNVPRYDRRLACLLGRCLRQLVGYRLRSLLPRENVWPDGHYIRPKCPPMWNGTATFVARKGRTLQLGKTDRVRYLSTHWAIYYVVLSIHSLQAGHSIRVYNSCRPLGRRFAFWDAVKLKTPNLLSRVLDHQLT